MKRLRLIADVIPSKQYADGTIATFAMYLITKFDVTANCRFEAARRMQKKNMASIISIVILSLYAILFALMPSFEGAAQAHKDVLAMLTIFMSASIIAFSLFELLKKYELRSEFFLRSARRLQAARDRLVVAYLSGKTDWEFFKTLETEYHEILNEAGDNHSRLDYDVVRAGKGEVTGFAAHFIKANQIFNVWLLPSLAATAPAIIALLYALIVNHMSMLKPVPG